MATPPVGEAAASGRIDVQADEDEAPRLTLVEHLEDLRRVVIISMIAWAAATVLAFAFNRELIAVLEHPLHLALAHRARSPFGGAVVVTSPIEGLSIPFKVAAAAGVVLSLPIVLWQIWTFIAPGLRRHERRLAGPFIAASCVCFALGSAFAYFVMPVGLSFLATFLGANAVYLPDLGSYLSFFTIVILIFGVTFEMPVVLSLLGALGIVSSKRLRHWRRPAYFLIVAVALVVTPGADPFTPTFLSAALLILYEASILVVRFPLGR